MFTVVLMAALLGAGPAEPPARIRLRDGDDLSGQVLDITVDGTVRIRGDLLKQEIRTNTTVVRQIEFPKAAPDGAGGKPRTSSGKIIVADEAAAQRILLADGTLLTGQAGLLDGARLELSGTFAGKLAVRRDALRAVVVSGEYSTGETYRVKPDFLRLRNGDTASCGVLSFEDGKLAIEAFFGKAAVPLDLVSFVAFGGGDEPDEPEAGPAAAEVVLANGDRLRGDVAGLNGKALALRTAWAGAVSVPRDAVIQIRFLSEERPDRQ